MTEPRKSMQKAVFEKLLEEGRGTTGHRLGVQYTRTDGDKGPTQGMTAFKLVSGWTSEEKELIKALKQGDSMVVNKVESSYTSKDGKQRTAWNLDTVADISTYKPREPRGNWNKGSGGGYDNLGHQIGNSITNAVVSLGPGHTVEEYKQRALEIVKAGDWIREQVTGKGPTSPTTSVHAPSSVKETKPVESDDDFASFLDSIPVGE